MSGNKVKLQLSRNLSMNDKSPSPTKLMINHGKPNFTINRQNSYKKFHVDTELKSNEIDKVVLKSPSVKSSSDKENFNANNKIGNDQEFLQQFRKISINKEKTDKITSTQNDEINQKQEFLNKFQQISEKLSTRDIDSIETPSLDIVGNINGNNCVYNVKVTNENGINENRNLNRPPQFAKMVDNRIQNAEINGTGFILPPGAICGKPYIPAKPVGLIPTTPPPPRQPPPPPAQPVISNGNGTLPIDPSDNGVHTMETKNEIQNQNNINGVNFEQKNIVSFSRDLYTAPNIYPDTAKVVISEMKSNFKKSEAFNEISKLKFDIATTGNDVTVTPVIR